MAGDVDEGCLVDNKLVSRKIQYREYSINLIQNELSPGCSVRCGP